MLKPIVAIIGRPNVGKSTLFNRILQKKIAVVDDLPGVTRDRNYAQTDWRRKSFVLVDTGGFVPQTKEKILQAVKSQIEIAINEADLLLFVLDQQTGITDLDEQIAKILRKTNKKVIVTVNKVDRSSEESQIYQFLRLGLGEPQPISAIQGLGIGELLDFLVKELPEPAVETGFEPVSTIKVAVIGHPNVGKSSLINAILGEERVIVDERPGTTRDAVDSFFFWQGHSFTFIDTAGLRRRSKIKGAYSNTPLQIEYYTTLRTLRSLERAEIAIIVLDASEGITKQDKNIAGYADELHKGILFAFNKWDLVKEKEPKTYSQYLRKQMPLVNYAPVAFICAIKKEGIETVLKTILEVNHEKNQRVSEADLNHILSEAVKAYPPKAQNGKYIRLYNLKQVDIAPPKFVILTNEPKLIERNYLRYLNNQIRKKFPFIGVGIKFILRKHKG
ncbi:MAG: ribosome biogenesis GTPase Der [Candidatus Edwardsbacteria bacterium]